MKFGRLIILLLLFVFVACGQRPCPYCHDHPWGEAPPLTTDPLIANNIDFEFMYFSENHVGDTIAHFKISNNLNYPRYTM